ncbi:MAG: tetratricopeptide repeat protein [Candidatus Thorarchaeota archaeon]
MTNRNPFYTYITDSLDKELLKAARVFAEQKFEEAIQIINNFEKKGQINSEDQLSFFLLKGWISSSRLQFKEIVNIGELAYTLSQKLDDKIALIDALMFKSMEMFLGKLGNVNDYIYEAENILNSLIEQLPAEYFKQRGDIEYRKAWFNILEGNLSKALEHAVPCLEIYEKTQSKPLISTALMTIGYSHFMRGDLQIGLDYAMKGLIILKEIGYKDIFSESMGEVGFIYYDMGDLNQALIYANQGLSIKGISDRSKVNLLRLLGNVYRERGELDLALQYLNKALVLGEQEDFLYLNTFILSEIGATYRMKGNYEKALKHLESSLEISKKMGAYQGICYSLDFLVLINLDMKNREQANHYFKQLNKFIDKTDYRFMIQGYNIVKALMLKTKGRSQNRADAEKLLKQVVEEGNMDPIFQSLAVVLLCDLLIEELSLYNDPEILEEIEPLINRLLSIAENQKSSYYLAETKLFQAKLALIQMKFEEAQKLMTEAQNIAEAHDLNLLAINISGEHDALLDKLKDWERLKDIDVPLSERINLASFDAILGSLQGKGPLEPVDLEDEQSILLLILAEGGILIYSYSFTEEWKFDDELFGGFLTAFNSISDEIFAEGLDRVKFGQNTVLMESIENFIACYLFKGQTYPAKQKLTKFIDEIKKSSSIWQTLDTFHKTSQVVEPKDLPQIEELIKEIFIS